MVTANEKAELHRTIWRMANDLRGSVDGWDFKAYVLGMLLYRFMSERLAGEIDAAERQLAPDFSYAAMDDDQAEFGRAESVGSDGYFIRPSQLFCNVRARARQDENLNETLEQAFAAIESSAKGTPSEEDFEGLFADIDVNSPRLGPTVAARNKKLVALLDAVGDLDFGPYSQSSIDAFGDAYEYLMTMYASSAGKSGGEFFTPQEVSDLLARLAVYGKTQVNKVYDPACGSGSLLLKFAKVLGKENVKEGFFGQEINLTTYNLCRQNMILHGIDFDRRSIALGDTLLDPVHVDEEPFEAIVSNPPYSIKWEGDANPVLINDERFAPAGVLAPKSKADLAFTMHMLAWLAENGTAAIVEFPGVLYRGKAEKKIRRYLVENNFVDCVIQLPANLFFGTSIATCILVLKRARADDGVLFIDASALFEKQTNMNVLGEGHRERILQAFGAREEVAHFAHVASIDDIAANDYNLSVSSYVEPEDTREIIDIAQLNAQIEQIVARQGELRAQIDAIVADLEGGAGA